MGEDKNYTFEISDLIEDTITIGDFSTDSMDAITITLDTGTYSTDPYTVSLDSVTTVEPTYTTLYNQDFVDTMPSVHRIDEMCKEYPALAKAYENFKSMYKMCDQDYTGKLKAQGLDDDIPF